MSGWNGFGDLDLANIAADEGGSRRLEVGEYLVKCVEAKVETIGESNNRRVVADLQDTGGKGDIRVNFNVFHSSAEAQEIGLRQLKSFLTASGHSNPDKPGDISSLKGLECKVYVGMGKPWRDRSGVERQQTEVKKFIIEQAAADKAEKKGGAEKLDDEIPF